MRTIVDWNTVKIGDRVLVKRNLAHPAWCEISTNEHGDVVKLPKPGIEEVIGESVISEVRRRAFDPSSPISAVRAHGGLWYRTSNSCQEGSEATFLELI